MTGFEPSLMALPALMAVTALVAAAQVRLWLRHQSEGLHLRWAIWCGIGLAFLAARFGHHLAAGPEAALLAIRLQYAFGYVMLVAMILVIHEQVGKPLRLLRPLLLFSTPIICAVLLVSGMAAEAPVYVRTDAVGQEFLDASPGRLVPAFALCVFAATCSGAWMLLRYGRALPTAHRVAFLFTLLTITGAGSNDLLMAIDAIDSVRLAEFGTAAIALSAHFLMLRDYNKMVDDMEGLVAARTAELHAMTASARRAEESFRALIDGSPDAVIVTREDRVVFANAAAAELLELDEPGALLGQDLAAWIHPEDRPAARDQERRARSTGEATALREERYLGGAGAPPRGEVARVPVVFEGEESIASVVRDISERRRMEQQLQFAERMASLGTLAAGMAHEINNPMTYVLGNVHVLRGLVPEPGHPLTAETADEIDELLGDMEDGSRRVVHIVRDLKTFSRPGSGDDLEPLRLDALLDDAAALANNEIRHRAQLVKSYQDQATVLGNRVRLGQVLLNLVVNAAQAMDAGDVESNCIALRSYTDADGTPVAEVEDTGGGISPEARPQIFVPFFTTKEVGVGTGLGLSSAHAIVSGLGGTIEVESELGRGTLMRVRLPPAACAASAPAGRATRAARRNHPALPRRRLLLVDDEPAVSRTLERSLPDYDVAVETEGRAALERWTREEFDVLLCDLMMPDLSGMDLYDELRRLQGELATARVVFITGGAFTERARRFCDAVPNPCLEKPVSSEQIRAAVEATVRDAPRRREH